VQIKLTIYITYPPNYTIGNVLKTAYVYKSPVKLPVPLQQI